MCNSEYIYDLPVIKFANYSNTDHQSHNEMGSVVFMLCVYHVPPLKTTIPQNSERRNTIHTSHSEITFSVKSNTKAKDFSSGICAMH